MEGDPTAAAEAIALHYASDDEPGILRHKAGRGFRYTNLRGKPVRDAATLSRIRAIQAPCQPKPAARVKESYVHVS